MQNFDNIKKQGMVWYVCYKCQSDKNVSQHYLPCIYMEPVFSQVSEHTEDDFRRMALMRERMPMQCLYGNYSNYPSQGRWKLVTFEEVIHIIETTPCCAKPVMSGHKQQSDLINELKTRFSDIEVVMEEPESSESSSVESNSE